MQRRRTGRIVVALTLLVVAAAAAAATATGRLPLLRRTWSTVASAVGSVVAPPAPSAAPSASAADGGGVAPDAASEGLPRRQAAPLSSAQLGAPLVHGGFVTACGAPDDMKVVIKADVRLGRAINVAVKTDPPNLMIASCIERATRDLQWDVSPKVGHVTVRY
jgi:hypothetical protein